MPPTMTIISLMVLKWGLAIVLFAGLIIYGIGPLVGWHPAVLPILPDKHFVLDLIGLVVVGIGVGYLAYQIGERFDNKIYPMRAGLSPNNLFHLSEYELEKLGLGSDGRKKNDNE